MFEFIWGMFFGGDGVFMAFVADAFLVALGGNEGDSRKIFQCSLDAIQELGYRLGAVSSLYMTAAVGDTEQSDFFNACAVIDNDRHDDADTFLSYLHKIEAKAGRIRDPNRRYGPRTLDLDLLLMRVGECDVVHGNIGQQRAILPHPRMHERRFVLIPASEVAGNWRHPKMNMTVEEMRKELDEKIRYDKKLWLAQRVDIVETDWYEHSIERGLLTR